MGKSVRYTVRGVTIEVREGDDPKARELFAWSYRDGCASVEGYLSLAWEADCATAGNFAVCMKASRGTAHALLFFASRVLAKEKIPGVLIHVDNKNSTRKMYKRMGFEQTNIPGIMTANLETIRARLCRWRYAHLIRQKV